MTFEWEDIADKVLFAAYRDGDMATAVTEAGQEYIVEFDEFDGREKEREVLERFLGESAEIGGQDTELKHFRETGKWLYRWLPFAYVYVRKDFFSKFISEFEKQSVKRYLTAQDTVRRLLDPQGKLLRLAIREKRQHGEWETLTFEQQHIKEIDEALKQTEQEVLESKQKLFEESIPLDEFFASLKAKTDKGKECEEPVTLTFEWNDITDEVIEKVVFVEFKRNNIHFPGSVTAVTEEGLQYFAELYEYDKEDDVRERFLGDNTETDEQYAVPDDPKDFRAMGKWLYKRGAFSQIFVRKDFFDRFISEYEKRKEESFSALSTARELLDPQGKMTRMIHSETKAMWEWGDEV